MKLQSNVQKLLKHMSMKKKLVDTNTVYKKDSLILEHIIGTLEYWFGGGSSTSSFITHPVYKGSPTFIHWYLVACQNVTFSNFEALDHCMCAYLRIMFYLRFFGKHWFSHSSNVSNLFRLHPIHSFAFSLHFSSSESK